MLLFKNLLFTLVVPGTVAVFVPLSILRGRHPLLGLGFAAGIALLALGDPVAMTKAEFRALLEALAAAWTRRDYVSAAEAFAPDVRYSDPWRYALASREELHRFFADDEGREQSTVWHTVVFDEDQQVGAAEYTYQGTHRYHGTVLIRVHDGKITHWREYQHVDSRSWEELAGETRF